jgi:hypothetical protein
MLLESRLPMRKTREVLRLHFESHLVPGQIAIICNGKEKHRPAVP